MDLRNVFAGIHYYVFSNDQITKMPEQLASQLVTYHRQTNTC